MPNLQEIIIDLVKKYQKSFQEKVLSDDNVESDILMDIFGITYKTKQTNKQFWNRELGMLWQKIVTETFRNVSGFNPPQRYGQDEPYDLKFHDDCIDTKYRIGSGDAGTLKKLKQYGELITNEEKHPIMLILREDNLRAAITACANGGWTVFTGQKSFDYIKQKTGMDLQELLKNLSSQFRI